MKGNLLEEEEEEEEEEEVFVRLPTIPVSQLQPVI
jgi:hypothetical protein